MAGSKWDYLRTAARQGVGVIAPSFEPRKRTEGRVKRTEAQIKREVYEILAERDATCRVEGMAPGVCRGRLEWAHLRPRSRWQTRGMPPEFRHTTTYGARMCDGHHDLYDAYVFDIEFLDPDRGADGPIQVVRR